MIKSVKKAVHETTTTHYQGNDEKQQSSTVKTSQPVQVLTIASTSAPTRIYHHDEISKWSIDGKNPLAISFKRFTKTRLQNLCAR